MRIFLLITFLGAISLCHAQIEGRYDGNRYINDFFDFSIDIPSDWSIQSQETAEELIDRGKTLVSGGDEDLEAALEDIKVSYLLMAYKYEVGAAVEYNPGIMILAENIKHAPGIKTGAEYLFHSRQFMRRSAINYTTIDDKFAEEKVGNARFYKMNAVADYMGIEIHQTYYAMVTKGFALCIVMSSNTPKHKAEIKSILKTFKLD